MNIGIVLLTLNAELQIRTSLDGIQMQRGELWKKIIIDSESTDHTVQLAKEYHFDVISIKRSSFNHGGTRNLAVQKLQDLDIIIFMTQDAILADAYSIKKLVAYFDDPKVGAAYGRQLPHKGASPLAAHARLFNYRSESRVKSFFDRKKIGIKAPFMSDSFAAYRVSAVQEVGGFPERVIVSEDMYVGATLLKAGYKIAYAADAKVYHSHDYTLLQELRRYFDIGVFQCEQPWIRKEFGAAEGEGIRFVRSQIKYLCQERAFFLIIKAIFLNMMKLCGYRLGVLHSYIPVRIKKHLSGQSYYFGK